ncbi:MAG: energy transducer TonB [Campylobacteraceae bacterium]|jgi:protein TonB|nr:energy transducer TonB [Campylobacteraceae bacterium]
MRNNLYKSFTFSSVLYAGCIAAALTAYTSVTKTNTSDSPKLTQIRICEPPSEPQMAQSQRTENSISKPKKQSSATKQLPLAKTEEYVATHKQIEPNTTSQQNTQQKSDFAQNQIAHQETKESPAFRQEAMDENKEYVKLNIAKIRELISKYKRYPNIAIKMGAEGVSSISFKLNPNGVVEDIRIVKSSGYSYLDKSSIQTIEEAAADMPKPHKAVTLIIPIEYRLN